MKVLVTEAAGFIGTAVSHRLLDEGDVVIGYDNLNDYYDLTLQQARPDLLLLRPGFRFEKGDVADRAQMEESFAREKIEQATGRKAIRNLLPLQPGNVLNTWVDATDLERDMGFTPSIGIEHGMEHGMELFVDWHRGCYQI